MKEIIENSTNDNLIQRLTKDKENKSNCDYLDDESFYKFFYSINIKNINVQLTHFKDKKLTDSQIEFLFKKYYEDKANHINKQDSIARSILIFCLTPSIRKVLQLSKLNYFDNDFYSMGLIGLIKAVDTYKLNSNTKFLTLAMTCIRNEIFMHFRKSENKIFDSNGNPRQPLSLDALLLNNRNDDYNLYEVLKDEYDFVEELSYKDFIDYVITYFRFLTPIEQICLRLNLGLGAPRITQAKIAILLKTSRPCVCHYINKAISKLKLFIVEQKCNSKTQTYSILSADEILNYINAKKEL